MVFQSAHQVSGKWVDSKRKSIEVSDQKLIWFRIWFADIWANMAKMIIEFLVIVFVAFFLEYRVCKYPT